MAGSRDERHQLSYTLVALHAGAFPDSGAGIGDIFLNYRYQLVGNADTRVAFSPRLSVIFPTGEATVGRGSGSFGLQTNLPLSVVVNQKLVTHWNMGATFIPNAEVTLDPSSCGLPGTTLGRALYGWSVPASTSCSKLYLCDHRSLLQAIGRGGPRGVH